MSSRVKNLAFVTAVDLITQAIERYKTNDTKDFPKYQVLPGLEDLSPEQILFVSIARVRKFLLLIVLQMLHTYSCSAA